MIFKYPKATITRVIDGDTVDAVVDTGFYNTHRDRFRLIGIDTPEMRGEERPEGIRSKQYVIDLIEGKDVELESHGQDAFGRWLCVIYVDGMNLNEHLIETGYAKRYVR